MIEDYVEEQGKPILLKKEELIYSPQNLVACRRIYDSTGAFSHAYHYEHDSLGRLIKQVDPLGQEESYAYDKRGNRVEERTPTTHTTITFDFRNQPTQVEKRDKHGMCVSSHTEYDLAGNKTAQIDFSGNPTFAEYDREGNARVVYPPRLITPLGTAEMTQTTRQFDILGNLIKETDGNGNTCCRSYNDRGQVTTILYPDGTQEINHYFLNGELETHTDVSGLVTRYTRDYRGRPVTVETVDPEGACLLRTLYGYQGDVLSKIHHPDGTTIAYAYDAAGRLIEENHEGARTTYAYDLLGRKAEMILWDNETATVYRYEYDPLDRLIKEAIYSGDGDLISWEVFGYDYDDNLVLSSKSGDDSHTDYGLAGPISLTDPLGNTTTTTYDYGHSLGGLNVLQKIETDTLGNRSITTHNPRGQVLNHSRESVAGVPLASTLFFYDACDNKTFENHRVHLGGKTLRDYQLHWIYDSMHRPLTLRETSDGYSRTTHYFYHLGRLASTIKPSGIEINRTYDSLGRLSIEAGEDFQDTYTYDLMDRLIGVSSADGTTTQRVYNTRGHLISETLANGQVLTYEPTFQGRLARLVLPDRSSVNYTYSGPHIDTLNRGGYTFSYAYNGHGQPTQVCGPIRSSVSYNAGQQPLHLTAPHFSQTCQYDAVGNLTSQTSGQCQQRYTYDDLYQLTAEAGTFNHSFEHDSIGNRQVRDGISLEVSPLNQLLATPETKFTYDQDGNTSSQGATQYRYDTRGRLIEIEASDTTTKYTYDPLHRRLTRTTYRPETQGLDYCDYLYVGDNQIGACTAAGELVCFRPIGPGIENSDIGASPLLELSGKTYFPIYDHRGSIALLLDADKQPIEYYAYSSFGEMEVSNSQGHSIETSQVGNPYGFLSKPSHHRLIFFGRRYYQVEFGRWLTPDPKLFNDGPNLYAYCHNRPLTEFDLYGLSASSTAWNIYLGINDGFTNAVLNFFPDLYRTLDSTCNFIWDCTAHPIQAKNRVIHDFSVAHQTLLHGSWGDRVGFFAPNTGSLINNWRYLTPDQRGYHLGSIAGHAAGSFGMAVGVGGITSSARAQLPAISSRELGLKPLGVQLAEQSSLSRGFSAKWNAQSDTSLYRNKSFFRQRAAEFEIPGSNPIYVTPEGIAVPALDKYRIPSQYVENPFRSSSYGVVAEGKYQEMLRIDSATPPGCKGPNYSHYHLEGKRTHYSPNGGHLDPGFCFDPTNKL